MTLSQIRHTIDEAQNELNRLRRAVDTCERKLLQAERHERAGDDRPENEVDTARRALSKAQRRLSKFKINVARPLGCF